MKKRKIINIETLEVFNSLTDVAKKYNCFPSAVFNNIVFNYKTKGNRFEYFDEWTFWTSKEKEKFTKRNNIFFMRSKNND